MNRFLHSTVLKSSSYLSAYASCRASSTPAQTRGSGTVVRVTDDAGRSSLKLQLSAPEEPPLLLHPLWLRDHCRCHRCYDRDTHCKLVDIGAAGPDCTVPQSFHLSENHLNVIWKDGHLSAYSLDWLQNNLYENYKDELATSSKTLWSSSLDSVTIADNVVSNYDDYMRSDEKLEKLLRGVAKFGFAIVQKTPVTKNDVLLKVAERICPPRLGFFGKLHAFSRHMLHSGDDDGVDMVPHADQTYLSEPAGLKLVLCLAGDGPVAVHLVDGYQVARQLEPAAYAALSSVPVVSEYVDDRFHHKVHEVVLKHDSFGGHLLQVRYNVYHRTSVTFAPFSQMDSFYSALGKFTDAVRDDYNRCSIQLSPGTVLLMDNWRVLSSVGRGGRLHGCYLGWSDYRCRARRLGITCRRI